MLEWHGLVLWGGLGLGRGGTGTGMWMCCTGTVATVVCIGTRRRLNLRLRLIRSLVNWFCIGKGARLGASSCWTTCRFGLGCVFIDHLDVVLSKNAEIPHYTQAAHCLKSKQDTCIKFTDSKQYRNVLYTKTELFGRVEREILLR